MMIRVLLLSLLFLFASCASKESSFRSAKDAKEHMTESNKLNELMHELDMVVYDRFKSELQRDNIRRRYALNIAEKIKKLAFDIKEITPDKLGLNATKENIEIFNIYAKKLYKNSQEIEEIAQKYELEKLPSSLETMERTCNSCHSNFRIYNE